MMGPFGCQYTSVHRAQFILAAPPTEGRQIGLPLVSVPPLTVPVPVGVGVRTDISQSFKLGHIGCSDTLIAFGAPLGQNCPIGVKITLKRRLT